jgi:thiol-disulfide isomerase/thioredoxin
MKREVILVGASWCGACKAMRDSWFFTIEIPGVTFSYRDISEMENEGISSVPVILFREGETTIQTLNGAVSKNDLIRCVKSIFGEREA